jgi:hypothetical protein
MSTNRLLERAISLPFTVATNGSIASTSTEEKLWQDKIVSALMTRKSERVRRNQYGTSINAVALDNLSVAKEEIQKEVSDVFRILLSPLTLASVTLDNSEDSSTLNVLISYWLPSYNRETDSPEQLRIAGFAAVTAEGTYFEERR